MQNVPAFHLVERKNFFFFGGRRIMRDELRRVVRQKSCAIRLARNRFKMNRLSEWILGGLLVIFRIFDFVVNRLAGAFFIAAGFLYMWNGDSLSRASTCTYSGRSSSLMTPPSESTIACSMMFSSSRMLPG